MTRKKMVHGAVRLACDAVEHGARAIEEVHLATAARTFDVLDAVPVVAEPSRAVRVAYEAFVRIGYGSVRVSARGVAKAADLAAAVSGVDVADPAAVTSAADTACSPRTPCS